MIRKWRHSKYVGKKTQIDYQEPSKFYTAGLQQCHGQYDCAIVHSLTQLSRRTDSQSVECLREDFHSSAIEHKTTIVSLCMS